MKRPLTVKMSQDDLGITLYCPELNIHTCGQSEAEARRKFVDALFAYYEFLEAHDFRDESPYREHLALLTAKVLPSLTNVSLRSPHRPKSFVNQLLDAFSQRGEALDADIFGSLVRSAAA